MSPDMSSMLSNPKLVTEDYRVIDLLNFETYALNLKAKIDEAPDKSIFGIIGDYGTGKSVMLEQLKSKLPEDAHWVHFDAWKYPERSNLWEGFVLDFVSQVSNKDFKVVLQKMDGTSRNDAKDLIGAASALSNLVLPGSGVAIDKLTHFASTSPAKRVFQIQEILRDLISKKAKGPIYVVVEDADRSGDAGIYFIETLSQFLRNLDIEGKIKVFVPIARQSYVDRRDTYIKTLDYVEFFNLASGDLTLFVEKVFNTSVIADALAKHHIIEWLQRLAHVHGFTVRDLKFVIRNSDSRFKSFQQKGYRPDPRVVLIVESMRHILNPANEWESLYEEAIRNMNMIPGRSQAELMLFAIERKVSTEVMAEILNDKSSHGGYFRRQIRFIDKTIPNATADTPFQHEGQCSLPLYYLQ
jgi:hypothetical protein